MEDAKREILLKVSRGELTPQEAAVELEVLETEQQPTPPPIPVKAAGGLRKVRIVNNMGTVSVVGDPSVQEAVAEGPHKARRDGDILVIEADEDAGGFVFETGRRWRFGAGDQRRLNIRMHPDLELEADVSAGSLRIEGIKGPIGADVQAGSVKIFDFESPLHLDVQAGSVKASGRLTAGKSTISCQAGSVKIDLLRGSDVRVKARAQLGKVTMPDGTRSVSIGGGAREWISGSGTASLDIEAEMGSVQVTAEA
jgi:hypothetical protein